jgi:hypothetical protein
MAFKVSMVSMVDRGSMVIKEIMAGRSNSFFLGKQKTFLLKINYPTPAKEIAQLLG